jgi:hypothetical protein
MSNDTNAAISWSSKAYTPNDLLLVLLALASLNLLSVLGGISLITAVALPLALAAVLIAAVRLLGWLTPAGDRPIPVRTVHGRGLTPVRRAYLAYHRDFLVALLALVLAPSAVSRLILAALIGVRLSLWWPQIVATIRAELLARRYRRRAGRADR